MTEFKQFGVKGMHWGVHKSEGASKAQKIKSLTDKIDRIDPNRVIDGHSQRGYYLNKQYNKLVKADPKFAYSKLSAEDKKKYQAKASRAAIRTSAVAGVIESILVAGGGALLVSQIATGRPAKQAQVGFALLGAKVLQTRVSEIRNVKLADKFERLQAERDSLRGKR